MSATTVPASRKVGWLGVGGGVFGGVQPGQMQKLWDIGCRPDLLVGVSVGAINCTGFAARRIEALVDSSINPADRIVAMWQDSIRHPHDIATFPVSVLELGALPFFIWKAITEPDDDIQYLKRIRSFGGRVRDWKEYEERRRGEPVSLIYPVQHPIHFFRWMKRSFRDLFVHGFESPGLADQTPIDSLIDKINFVSIKRVCDDLEVIVVTTNEGDLGLPTYWSSRDYSPVLMNSIVKASIGLPPQLSSVNIEGEWHGDGGISDPLPIEQLIDRGCDEVHVLATHPQELRINSELHKDIPLLGSILAVRRAAAANDFRGLNLYRKIRDRWINDPRVIFHTPESFPDTVTSTLMFEGPDDITAMIAEGRASVERNAARLREWGYTI